MRDVGCVSISGLDLLDLDRVVAIARARGACALRRNLHAMLSIEYPVVVAASGFDETRHDNCS